MTEVGLPIVSVRTDDDGVVPVNFLGTGFLVADGVLVTCAHCLPNWEGGYAVVGPGEPVGRIERVSPLTLISHDDRGFDLAVARVDLPLLYPVALHETVEVGSPANAIGYPLVTPEIAVDERRIDLDARLLRGYVTRTFNSGTEVEIDMPAPGGLSGAAVFDRLSEHGMGILGVIKGQRDTYSIVNEAQVIGDETVPESRRYVTFAVAQHSSTLLDLSGPATEGVPLREIVRTIK